MTAGPPPIAPRRIQAPQRQIGPPKRLALCFTATLCNRIQHDLTNLVNVPLLQTRLPSHVCFSCASRPPGSIPDGARLAGLLTWWPPRRPPLPGWQPPCAGSGPGPSLLGFLGPGQSAPGASSQPAVQSKAHEADCHVAGFFCFFFVFTLCTVCFLHKLCVCFQLC